MVGYQRLKLMAASLLVWAQVLIPGAGLGRLCLDVAAGGYAAQVITGQQTVLLSKLRNISCMHLCG